MKSKCFSLKNLIIIIVILVFSFLFCKTIDEFSLRRYTVVDEHISETDSFRNPRMQDDTLYNIRIMSERENADFIKVTSVLMNMNQFDLRKYNEDSLNIKRINQIYKKMTKSKGFNEYYESMSSILADIRYFPVAYDNEESYKFAFEDSFGSARSYNGDYSHEGTDIMAGTNISGIYPIISVSDGVVENVGWLPKGGYRIGVRGENGAYFYYAHLDEDGITVKTGDRVSYGKILGYMGDTGYGNEGTTGKFPVHLHFGIYIKTKNHEELSINPYYLLRYLENFPLYINYTT